MSEGPPKIVAIILTKDEERDLPGCLDSLVGLARQVHVVDSGSTDRTLEIAKVKNAIIHHHDWVNHSQQFNWALDTIALDCEWLIRIDADERITAALANAIKETVGGLGPEVTGLEFSRRIHFLGRSIRWGDSYPVWLLRMWRSGIGRCEDTWMDEHIVLSQGRTQRLEGDLLHLIPKNLSEWVSKHNSYATLECQDILTRTKSGGERQNKSNLIRQAAMKRWVKQNVYLRTPMFLRAFCYWAYRYFLRFGFLDGKEGFVYHFLHAFWYRFLVDAKLFELEKTGL